MADTRVSDRGPLSDRSETCPSAEQNPRSQEIAPTATRLIAFALPLSYFSIPGDQRWGSGLAHKAGCHWLQPYGRGIWGTKDAYLHKNSASLFTIFSDIFKGIPTRFLLLGCGLGIRSDARRKPESITEILKFFWGRTLTSPVVFRGQSSTTPFHIRSTSLTTALNFSTFPKITLPVDCIGISHEVETLVSLLGIGLR